ncbi:PaaX family transcriptional regulator C-terminal domain-containing protein [Streptomyces sp. NPDC059567]|uniref:PaaX family transcriptional regulator C-terminal domain-containing protein n=1 Tax=Streptomyces sp. NPDC059567 TaxID=3346867 RepID=UPI00368ED947
MSNDRSTPAALVPKPEVSTRLLVHALVRADATVDAEELYTVAGLLGMTDQQVRLCVKRLVAEGRFTHEGRGRKAAIRAVADVTGSLAPDAAHVRHAYRQDRGLAPWDGTWHLFAFAIPESSRAARDTLRDTLLHLGAAPVQNGLYVSANPIDKLVETHARHLGVHGSVTFLTSTDLRVGDMGDGPALAAALWPLGEIAARHERLAAFAASCLDRLDGAVESSDAERLTMAVELAAEFAGAMHPDPLLPPELLPRPWPGSRARELTASCWTALLDARSTPTTRGARGAPRPLPRLFELYSDAFRV